MLQVNRRKKTETQKGLTKFSHDWFSRLSTNWSVTINAPITRAGGFWANRNARSVRTLTSGQKAKKTSPSFISRLSISTSLFNNFCVLWSSASLFDGMAMQNHQFDLQAGESVIFGNYKVTLLEIENDAAVLEIEGPDGEVRIEPIRVSAADLAEEFAAVV